MSKPGIGARCARALGCALLTLASCAPGLDAGAEVREAMSRYDREVIRMDPNAIAAFYTPDGELSHAGETQARGRDSIVAFLAPFSGQVRVEANQSEVQSVLVTGDTATATGTFRQRVLALADNREIEVSGTFVAEWIRAGDGHWLVRKMSTWPPS
jgi:uncharacterized protein (TIGR02246 family)